MTVKAFYFLHVEAEDLRLKFETEQLKENFQKKEVKWESEQVKSNNHALWYLASRCSCMSSKK